MGNQIFLMVLSLSLSGTLIGILILCLRPLTKRFFSKRWNYYVWIVMVARLLLPISLGINLTGALFAAGSAWRSDRAAGLIREEVINEENSLGGEITDSAEMMKPAGMVEPLDAVEPVGMPEPVEKAESVSFVNSGRQSLFSYLWMVWLFGVILAACIKGNDYRNFAAYVKAGRQEIGEGRIRELADELSQKLGIRKRVKVYESPLVSGPILIGLWNPCMILPKDICSADGYDKDMAAQDDVVLVLHHELIHCKKKDLWYKWLYQAVLCIHWFNPVLYLIGRTLNMDCELACDEAVMKILTLEGRKAYGNVLIDAAEHSLSFKKSALSTTLLEDKSTLKERLNAILHYKKTKGILAVFSVGLLGVIVVLAGFAGVRDSRRENTGSLSREVLAGGYVSGWDALADTYTSSWDNVSAGYETLWDDIGEAAGSMWDGLGQMWSDLGDTLSDAVSDIGEEGLIWSFYDNADQFLSQSWNFDKQGDAWKLYDNDEMIAKEDLTDCWQAHQYMGNGGNVRCKGLILNGSDTYEILYAKEAFSQTVDVETKLVSGRMKLVHIGADGSVTLLAELEGGDSLNKSINISLTEGRNVVKVVGQGAKIQNLRLQFGNQDSKKVEKLYASDTHEAAAQICDEFRQGKTDVDRFMNAMPYMNEDNICECAKILFDDGEELTAEQISYLLVYGNESVGTYLADAVEKETMRPRTGEEIRGELVYYISSADAVRLVECMDGTLDFETLKELMYYLDEADKEKCLDLYLRQGNTLSYEEFSELSHFLDEDVVKKLYEKRK